MSATATETSGVLTDGTVFTLRGGKYGVVAQATFGGGSVKLQMLGPDATNYVSVSSATDFTAAGYAVIDLPPGRFKFTIATATGVTAQATRIPA